MSDADLETRQVGDGPTEPVVDADDGRDGGRGRRRVPPIAVIVGVVVVITVLTAAVLVLATPPEDPAAAPDRWDSLDFDPEQDITIERRAVDLGERRGQDVSVIVHAAQEVCWNGYIVSEAIDGCGRAVYEVTGAPAAFGSNVRSTSEDRLFLGLAVWDGAGETKLHSLETKKPFGTLAVTVNL